MLSVACGVATAGPKTLCNACGVKLVRANAKQKDGLKRRAAAAGGAGACAVGGGHGGSGPRAVAPAPVARPAVLPKPEAGSPTSDGGAARARNSALAAARRPQRKVHTPRRPAALERYVSYCASAMFHPSQLFLYRAPRVFSIAGTSPGVGEG